MLLPPTNKEPPRPRIIALVACFNDLRYLQGWFENIRGRVDGIVALDDGSTDSSADFIAAQPETTLLLRNPAAMKTEWDETSNRRQLVTAGQALGADWFLTIDCDERVEDHFWNELNTILAWADREAISVCSFRLRELWDSPKHFRVDGIWGRKTKGAFFRNLGTDHQFDLSKWHGEWFPMQYLGSTAHRVIPYDLYHLKMIEPQDRIARRQLYKSLDPDNSFQAIGYDYLIDDHGLKLEALPQGHNYRGFPKGCLTSSNLVEDENL